MPRLAYQDEILTEILDGQIIAMSPRPAVNHNVIIGNIYRIFGSYLNGKSCTVFSDGVDVYLTQKDRVIPDIMIVCNRDIIKKDAIYGVPDLVVEVLSPSTAKRDKGYKKNLYEKCGVKEYWLADSENNSIEVYLLIDGKFVLDDIYTIYPDYLLNKMSDEEKQEIKSEFKTSLYDDMTIILSDVFKGRF